MNNAGVFLLAAQSVSVAKPRALLLPQAGPMDLSGMSALSIEASFLFGSGSGTCSAIVATSFDKFTTARHIARFDFLNASRVAVANIQALAAKAIASYADLASEGVFDGILGSTLGVYVESTGTYSNTVLQVLVSVR